MSNTYFQFKQFIVHQEKCAMKVGTDGAILGAWAPLPKGNCPHILDIGCGTGVIALMIAQRLHGNAIITGIDVDQDAAIQAAENASESPWSEHINVVHASLQEFTPNTKLDLIVSNPPYFTKSLKNPNDQKSKARHNDGLPLSLLAEFAHNHLNENGQLAVILPPQEAVILEKECSKHGLTTVLRTNVFFKEGATSKRTLLAIGKSLQSGNSPITENSLTLAEAGTENKYTAQFRSLVRDFYLNID